ncbi:MAG TPA: protease modulator HflC [Polyangiaceae bacterium]|nr:protease modulator HflC [Polyangiaceae bacterium]
MNVLKIVVALLAVAAFIASSALFVVDETEMAIVTQFGEYKRSINLPGLYYKTPFTQTVMRVERRVLASDTPPTDLLTLDKKRLVADPVTRWRVADPLKFFKTVHDEAGAKARLDDIINSELRRELASHDFSQIVGKERDPLMQKVAANARKKSLEFGIDIVDVRIKRADLPKEVQESVFQRMRAERDRVAKQYRSEGEEEAAKIRAETDKEKTIILAKAYEAAETLRGTGDAEGVRIYAGAYGKDPEFYAFTRSLAAYEKSMGEESSLVLSTGSELFKYLGAPKK